MTRRRFCASALGVSLVAGAGAAQSEELTPVSFRLDWTVYGIHAPFFLALKEGLYKEGGLDVSIGEGQGSGTVVQLIGHGNDQLGFVDFAAMVSAVVQGIPVKAVARIVSNINIVISHEDNPIKNPSELVGKIVAFSPTESTGVMFRAMLAANDIDPTALSILSPAVGAKSALFLQGRIDAMPGGITAQVSQLEAAGAKVEYFMMSDYGIEVMAGGIVANNDFLTKNPDAVRSFIGATTKAFDMAKKNPARAIDALIAVRPEQARNRGELLSQLELALPFLTTEATKDKPFGWMAASDWAKTQDIMAEYRDLPKTIAVDNYYTNDFIAGN
jgi:NitT/TauT family transport system substrate-binding protein